MSNVKREEKYAQFYREIEKFTNGDITIQELSQQFDVEEIYEVLDNSIVIEMLTLTQVFQIFQVTLNHVYFIDIILNGTAEPTDTMEGIIEVFNDLIDRVMKTTHDNIETILERDLFNNEEMKEGYEMRLKDLKVMFGERDLE